MIILILIISYSLILYRNFELNYEFMALKRAPICDRNVCLSFFLRILHLIVIILIKENKKKLTLCQNNEKWTKKYYSLHRRCQLRTNTALQLHICLACARDCALDKFWRVDLKLTRADSLERARNRSDSEWFWMIPGDSFESY